MTLWTRLTKLLGAGQPDVSPIALAAPKTPVNYGHAALDYGPTRWRGQVTPPPFVKSGMALDSSCDDMAAWAEGGPQAFSPQDAWVEGLGFHGFPFLAQLSQRAEYRRAADVIADEMTRKGVQFLGDKTRAREMAGEFRRYRVMNILRQCIENDAIFGRAHCFADFGLAPTDPEYARPFLLDKLKIGKGDLRGFRTIDPTWVYPQFYEAAYPLSESFYQPQSWLAGPTSIHFTRMHTMVSKPVPNLLKSVYQFGGYSLIQQAMPYVNNWLQNRQAVADMLQSYSKDIILTDLSAILSGGDSQDLINRMRTYNLFRSNQGIMLLDKNKEEFQNVAVSLAGLAEILDASLTQICSVVEQPRVKYLGISPAGMNAGADGEIKVFYDSVAGKQERYGRPALDYFFKILQMNLWGEVDPELSFRFLPLSEPTETESAQIKKIKADTATAYINAGVLDPAEERERLAAEEEGDYTDIDPGKLPEIRDDEYDEAATVAPDDD